MFIKLNYKCNYKLTVIFLLKFLMIIITQLMLLHQLRLLRTFLAFVSYVACVALDGNPAVSVVNLGSLTHV